LKEIEGKGKERGLGQERRRGYHGIWKGTRKKMKDSCSIQIKKNLKAITHWAEPKEN